MQLISILDAIKKLVNDEELKERIQTENSISKFSELVEGLAKEKLNSNSTPV
jgi:hypothetical protein